jgi:hypothetical protein
MERSSSSLNANHLSDVGSRMAEKPRAAFSSPLVHEAAGRTAGGRPRERWALEHPHSSSFISSFNTKYSYLLSEIHSFISTSPAFVILYISPSSQLPTRGTHLSFSPPSSPTHSPLSHPVIPTELPLLSKDGGDLTHSRDPRATTSCSLPWRSSPASPTASSATARPSLELAWAWISGRSVQPQAPSLSSTRQRRRGAPGSGGLGMSVGMIGSNPALEREWPDLHGSRS